MSLIKSEDSSKWINAFVAIFSVFLGFLSSKFIDQLGIWFDLESKMSNIAMLSQAAGVLIGIVSFIYLKRSSKSSNYLNEVFDELVKVVWPKKDATMKITIGLVVALVIVASIFVSVDFVFKKILSFVY